MVRMVKRRRSPPPIPDKEAARCKILLILSSSFPPPSHHITGGGMVVGSPHPRQLGGDQLRDPEVEVTFLPHSNHSNPHQMEQGKIHFQIASSNRWANSIYVYRREVKSNSVGGRHSLYTADQLEHQTVVEIQFIVQSLWHKISET